MKALYYKKYGGPKVDIFGEIEKPAVENLKPNELLLEMIGASLNPVDYKQRSGGITKFLLTYSLPRIHGMDFIGKIIGKGDDVGDFEIGDVVFGMCGKVDKGSVAEFFVVDSAVCVRPPTNISPLEAVSVPLVGITSVLAFRDAGLKENEESGKRVLILGGAGGVGTCAIQLAKGLYGASFVATTASAGAKTELCENLGADLIVNYKEDPKLHGLKDLEPFDVIYDTCGSLSSGLPYLAEGGAVISIATAPSVEGLRAWVTDSRCDRLAYGARSFFFSSFGQVVLNRLLGATSVRSKIKSKNGTYNHVVGRGNGEIMEILKAELESERLRPVIDKQFPFEEAKQAMAYLESGRAAGKVVISIKED